MRHAFSTKTIPAAATTDHPTMEIYSVIRAIRSMVSSRVSDR